MSPIDVTPIQIEDILKAIKDFRKLEKRGSFYDMARRLLDAKYRIEAYVLFLATWNFASFRYVVTNFDVEGLEMAMAELDRDFDSFQKLNFSTLDIEQNEGAIARCFDRLASMKEVLYTGASKLMHLRSPNVFVIWDDYIRGGKPQKLYWDLPCVRDGKWVYKDYEKNGHGYASFLRDMQARFGRLDYSDPSKTFAKAIDEFNYINITLPIQAQERKIREEKDAQRHDMKAALRRLGRQMPIDELERLGTPNQLH